MVDWSDSSFWLASAAAFVLSFVCGALARVKAVLARQKLPRPFEICPSCIAENCKQSKICSTMNTFSASYKVSFNFIKIMQPVTCGSFALPFLTFPISLQHVMLYFSSPSRSASQFQLCDLPKLCAIFDQLLKQKASAESFERSGPVQDRSWIPKVGSIGENSLAR